MCLLTLFLLFGLLGLDLKYGDKTIIYMDLTHLVHTEWIRKFLICMAALVLCIAVINVIIDFCIIAINLVDKLQ